MAVQFLRTVKVLMPSRFCIVFFLFLSLSLEGKSDFNDKLKRPKQHVSPFAPSEMDHLLLINPHYKEACTGMFSVFNYVVGCLDLFEKGNYSGVTLDFGKRGLYYEQAKGLNWWSYYCEPISAGSHDRKVVSHEQWGEAAKIIYHTENDISRERAYELICKYIHFKPEVIQAVDQFYEEYFSSHPIIGVHYRGTDKDSEAKRVPFADVKKNILQYLNEKNLTTFSIFVATDEAPFLDEMIQTFGPHVVFIPSERSYDGHPLHLFTETPYQQGFESLIDCILLSKTDILIRTSSNLSLWSTYLNPKLPIILLNERHKY